MGRRRRGLGDRPRCAAAWRSTAGRGVTSFALLRREGGQPAVPLTTPAGARSASSGPCCLWGGAGVISAATSQLHPSRPAPAAAPPELRRPSRVATGCGGACVGVEATPRRGWQPAGRASCRSSDEPINPVLSSRNALG
jgi:hypothetical protein